MVGYMLIVYLYTVDWIRKADYSADVYIKIKTILVSNQYQYNYCKCSLARFPHLHVCVCQNACIVILVNFDKISLSMPFGEI